MVSSVDQNALTSLSQQVHRDDAIGEIVLWSIPDSLRIPVAVMQAAFRTLYWPDGQLEDGTPEPDLEKFCPTQPSFELAMSRAVRRGKSNRLVAKAEDPSQATFGVIRADIVRDGTDVDISGVKELQASVDKQTGRVDLADPILAATLQASVDSNRVHYAGRDLSSALIALVETAQGIRLRPAGGDYFVPKSGLAVVRKMERIIERATGGAGYVSAFSVGASRKERDTLSRHAHEALMAEIAVLDREIEQIADKVTNGETVRESTIMERVRKARSLREKASLYEDIASARVDDVKRVTDALIKNCNAMMGFA